MRMEQFMAGRESIEREHFSGTKHALRERYFSWIEYWDRAISAQQDSDFDATTTNGKTSEFLYRYDVDEAFNDNICAILRHWLRELRDANPEEWAAALKGDNAA